MYLELTGNTVIPGGLFIYIVVPTGGSLTRNGQTATEPLSSITLEVQNIADHHITARRVDQDHSTWVRKRPDTSCPFKEDTFVEINGLNRSRET